MTKPLGLKAAGIDGPDELRNMLNNCNEPITAISEWQLRNSVLVCFRFLHRYSLFAIHSPASSSSFWLTLFNCSLSKVIPLHLAKSILIAFQKLVKIYPKSILLQNNSAVCPKNVVQI